jgi:hypothetical protein
MLLKKRSPLLMTLFVLSMLCALSAAPHTAVNVRSQGAAVPRRAPKILASTILEDLLKRKRQRPRTSPRELAAYGNALLREKGFNYMFDSCGILTATGKSAEEASAPLGTRQTFSYRLERVDGRGVNFQIVDDNNEAGLCSECFFEIPALRVTKREMVIRAEGGVYRLRRPKEFLLDEAMLVDRTLRRVMRTWQMPYQTIPSGVSADGSKLYVEFNEGQGPDELLLELSEGGTLKFRARSEVGLRGRGEDILDFPKDPKNAYLSYMRFKVGGKTYIVKFTGPCT